MHPARTYLVFSFGGGALACFCGTTYVPYLRSIGLSMSDVTLLNVAFWAVITLAEVPTGLLADARSRSWSIRTGVALFCLSSLGYFLFARGFVTALIFELISGISFAFISGAETAWVTDALNNRGEAGRLKKTLADAAIGRSAGAIIGGVIGGFLGATSLRLPFLVDAFVGLALFVFVLCFVKSEGEPMERVTERTALRESLKVLKAQSSLRWILLSGMAVGLVLPYNLSWAVYTRERFGSGSVSWFWAYMFFAIMGAGYALRRWPFPERWAELSVCLSLLLLVVGMVSMGLAGGLPLFVFGMGVHEFGIGTQSVVSEFYVQKRVGDSYRATFGSFKSLFTRLAFVPILGGATLFYGNSSETSRIQGSWIAAGALLFFLTSALWFFRPRASS